MNKIHYTIGIIIIIIIIVVVVVVVYYFWNDVCRHMIPKYIWMNE
jgi:hypothetical protein